MTAVGTAQHPRMGTAGPAIPRRSLTEVVSRVGTKFQIGLGIVLAIVYLLTIGAEEDRITQLVIFAAAGVAVIWPAAGLAMLSIVMPMKEGEILGPVRFNAVLAGAISFGCLMRLPFDRIKIGLHPGVVLLLGYVIYSAVSIPAVLNGYPPAWTPSALNILLRLGTGVALLLSASYLFRLTSPRVFLWLALAGAGVAGLLALADITGFLPFPSLTHGLLDSTSGLRASGAFADPNFFGQYIATAAILGLGLLAVSSRRARIVLVPLVVIFFLCVVVSFSRTALIGAVAGVAVLLAMRHKRAALIFLLTAAVLGVTLYPAFLELRQGAQLTPTDQYDMMFTQDSRSTIAAAGLAMFAANPLFGVGFGVFQYVSPGFFEGGAPDSTYSHNQYVNILAEQGLVGAVMVFALVLTLAVALWRSRGPLRATALAMGATYLATSLFLHTATVFQSSSLMWLVMAIALAPSFNHRDTSLEA